MHTSTFQHTQHTDTTAAPASRKPATRSNESHRRTPAAASAIARRPVEAPRSHWECGHSDVKNTKKKKTRATTRRRRYDRSQQREDCRVKPALRLREPKRLQRRAIEFTTSTYFEFRQFHDFLETPIRIYESANFLRASLFVHFFVVAYAASVFFSSLLVAPCKTSHRDEHRSSSPSLPPCPHQTLQPKLQLSEVRRKKCHGLSEGGDEGRKATPREARSGSGRLCRTTQAAKSVFFFWGGGEQ